MMMKQWWARYGCAIWIGAGAATAWGQDVVINEIMYHPASENVLEEFVELYNAGTTNVNLGGWRLTDGIEYDFSSNQTIAASGYLVVAADVPAFNAKYPSVPTVVGGWAGLLSNSRNTITLEDATGRSIDSVTYADEGDWAIRERGPLLVNHRGWIWSKEHDGLGKSLELRNPALPNQYGQNWSSSITLEGTPGRMNSVRSTNIPPLIVNVAHQPILPTSSDSVTVSCRVIDEDPGSIAVRLHWRIDGGNPPPFTVSPMRDDGQSGDGVAGDGLYGVPLGAFADDTVVEFYVEAEDASTQARTWPAAAKQLNGTFAQTANALFQVEDDPYTGQAPLYKLILTTNEFLELGQIFNADPGSDAQMNATFIALDGTGVACRHLIGIRNRGHGSRYRSPHNFRLNFRSDDPWQGAVAQNLNAFRVHAQHIGAVMAQRAGVIGGNSRAVQLRVNNGPSPGGTPEYGHYAANEVINSDWADRHFPFNGGGNAYKVMRDIKPPDFNYRGENPNAYRNTYFKESNVSEDDWSDLIGMLRVMGTSNSVPFTTENARAVVDVEQWMLHLAVMAFFANNESGLNTGNNDDYYLYAGNVDARFLLAYHDLDSVLSIGSEGVGYTIWGATRYPVANDIGGVGPAFERFMHWPDFEPVYYATLQRLAHTIFTPQEFDPLVEQTLGFYTPTSIRDRIKDWMRGRRAYVLSEISAHLPPEPGWATVGGEPKSPTWQTSANLTVAGANIVAYRFKRNAGAYGPETPVGQPISLSNLPQGSTNTIYVLGKHANGAWQSDRLPTVSRTWIVDTNTPFIRLNEILASNQSAVEHHGTFPDMIELFNEYPGPIDLAGMRLTDDPGDPNKYVFPAGTTNTLIGPRSYLVVYANAPDGTPGLHAGFALDQTGEALYLYTSDGRLVDHVVFGHQLPDRSIGRLGQGGAWLLNAPTLGTGNLAQPTGDPAVLSINEWLTAGNSPFFEDFIELYNPGDLPVDLGSLYLTDEPIGAPLLSRITEATFIPGQGYLALIADGQMNQPGHVGFRLASAQGAIALVTSWQETIDYVAYGPQQTGVSTGRCPDGAILIQAQVLPTPGAGNACSTQPNPTGAGLVLNEILASNVTTLEDADGTTPDLVELHNASTNSVNLTDLRLTDGLAEPRQSWTFPPGTLLSAGGYLTIRFDPDHAVSATNTGFALSASGDSLYLLDSPINGSTVLDVVHFGLQTSDASIGRVPDGSTNWVLTWPTLGAPNLAASLGNPALIRLNEWMAEPASGADWFELYNPNDAPVAIGGYYLTDDLEAINKSRIPDLSFIGAVTNAWQKFVADGDLDQGAHHVSFSLKLDGEALGFYAPNGTQIDAYPLQNQMVGVSEGRLPDGSTVIVRFPETASPGERNFLTLPNVVVNEVLTHTDVPLEDAIELHNPSAFTVNIASWWLSDSQSNPFKFQIPPGTQLGPGGFVVFYENRFNDSDFAAVPFSLSSAKGDAVHLTAAPGGIPNGLRHTATFGPAPNGVSFGRYPTSIGADFVALTQRTFGQDSPLSVEQFRLGQGLPNAGPVIGPLVFTEIMYHPPDLDLADNTRDEFVELQNITANPVPLYDPNFPANPWRLRKGVDFDFPFGAIVPAGGFVLVVSFDPLNNPVARAGFEAQYGTNLVLYGPYDGKLDNGGEAVELQRPDTPQLVPGPDYGLVPYITVERIEYLDQTPWPAGGDGDGLSLQRVAAGLYGNDPANWRTAFPTPEPGTGGTVDTDGDGMPDDWEIVHGLNPNLPDADQDPDGDGLTNLEELQAGTNPRDPDSVLRIVWQSFSGNQTLLHFSAVPGKTYSVLYRQSLELGIWQTLTNIPSQAAPQEITVVDPLGGAATQRFYQLVTPARP